MKTTFIIVSLFIGTSTFIYPQLKNGSFLVGGGFTGKIESLDNSNYRNGGYTTTVEGDMKYFTFFPNAGYFVLENIAVGLTARIGLSDYELEYFNTLEATGKTNEFIFSYGIGAFFRYYYPIGDFAIIGELKYEWAWEDEERESKNYDSPHWHSKSKSERKGNIFSPALGISYFFNRYVSIESMLRYEIENLKYTYRNYNPLETIDERETKTKFKRFLIVIGLQVYFPTE